MTSVNFVLTNPKLSFARRGAHKKLKIDFVYILLHPPHVFLSPQQRGNIVPALPTGQ
jgi:hypothetical protein